MVQRMTVQLIICFVCIMHCLFLKTSNVRIFCPAVADPSFIQTAGRAESRVIDASDSHRLEARHEEVGDECTKYLSDCLDCLRNPDCAFLWEGRDFDTGSCKINNKGTSVSHIEEASSSLAVFSVKANAGANPLIGCDLNSKSI